MRLLRLVLVSLILVTGFSAQHLAAAPGKGRLRSQAQVAGGPRGSSAEAAKPPGSVHVQSSGSSRTKAAGGYYSIDCHDGLPPITLIFASDQAALDFCAMWCEVPQCVFDNLAT